MTILYNIHVIANLQVEEVVNSTELLIFTGAASYMPYTYAALPQTPSLQTATTGAFPGLPFQTASAQAASLQEARMQ